MLPDNDLKSLTLSAKPFSLKEVAGGKCLQRERLSDKFNRRDIQFYDVYIKKEGIEEVKEAGYSSEI
jgi:hypothetical protein